MVLDLLKTYFIFCLCLFFQLVVCGQKSEQKIIESSKLPSQLIDRLNKENKDRFDQLPSFLAKSHYQSLAGPVKTFTAYKAGVPFLKCIYDAKQQLIGTLKLDTVKYELQTFSYDNKGSLVRAYSPGLLIDQDTIKLFRNEKLKYKFWKDGNQLKTYQRSYSDKFTTINEKKFNENGQLQFSLLTDLGEDKRVQRYKYYYDKKSNRVTKIEEYELRKNKEKKTAERKLYYSKSNLKNRSTYKKTETTYEYLFKQKGDSILVESTIRTGKAFKMEKRQLFDNYHNSVAIQNFQSGTMVNDLQYKISYRDEQKHLDDKKAYLDLEEQIDRFYIQLHHYVDSLSILTTGNGYKRKEMISNRSRYKFLISLLENRHINKKPFKHAIVDPNIKIDSLEQIFENEKSTFYKVYVGETVDIYFPDEEKRDKQLIRLRGTYRDHVVLKNKSNPLQVTIKSKETYLLYKRNRRSGKWTLS